MCVKAGVTKVEIDESVSQTSLLKLMKILNEPM